MGMVKTIVVLKDTAAQVFSQPMFVPTTAVAVRSLREEMSNPNATSDVARHPDDFELYNIGTYSEDDASLAPLSEPQLIVRCKDLRDAS